jgi:hypothetical protein
MKVCQDNCSYFQTHGKLYQKKLLEDQAEQAKAIGNKEAEEQILGITKQKQECAFWQRVKYVMKKQTSENSREVHVKTEGGEVVELTSHMEVHDAIWSNIHQKRFCRAEEAPICNGAMQEEFDVMWIWKSARKFWKERTGIKTDLMSTQRTSCRRQRLLDEPFQKTWYRTLSGMGSGARLDMLAQGDIVSSKSGLHFSHYIAGAQSNVILHFSLPRPWSL